MNVSLIQSLMNTQQTKPTGLGLALKPNQIVSGKVLGILNRDLATIQFGSMKVIAELKAPIKLHATYLFQVVPNPNQLQLKMIKEVQQQQINEKGLLNQLLKTLAIPNSRHMKNVLSYFLENNLPITNDMITKAAEWTKNSPALKADLNIVKQLINKDLPLTDNMFTAIRSIESGHELSTQLTTLLENLSDGQVKTRLSQLIQNTVLDPQDSLLPPQEIAKLLKQIIHSFGFQHEYDLANPNNDNDLAEYDTLKSLLIEIAHNSNDHFVKDIAKSVVDKITGLQLMSGTDGPILQYMMQLPLQFGGKWRDLTIQWSGRKDKNRQIDANFCRILFYLDLDRLKETMVDIQIQNRIINVTVINETPQLGELVEKMQPNLKNMLGQMDYVLSSVKIQKPIHFKQSNQKNNLMQGANQYSGVDIRI